MAMNQLMVENVRTVVMVEPKNWTGAAGTDEYISLKNYHHVTFQIITGAWAAGTAAVTLLQALTVAAGSAKALTFGIPFVWISTAFTSDTPVKTAVVSNTFNLDTANTLYQIEVEASSLDVTNLFDCINLHVATPGANADLYCAIAHLRTARYAQALMPSAIID